MWALWSCSYRPRASLEESSVQATWNRTQIQILAMQTSETRPRAVSSWQGREWGIQIIFMMKRGRSFCECIYRMKREIERTDCWFTYLPWATEPKWGWYWYTHTMSACLGMCAVEHIKASFLFLFMKKSIYVIFCSLSSASFINWSQRYSFAMVWRSADIIIYNTISLYISAIDGTRLAAGASVESGQTNDSVYRFALATVRFSEDQSDFGFWWAAGRSSVSKWNEDDETAEEVLLPTTVSTQYRKRIVGTYRYVSIITVVSGKMLSGDARNAR